MDELFPPKELDEQAVDLIGEFATNDRKLFYTTYIEPGIHISFYVMDLNELKPGDIIRYYYNLMSYYDIITAKTDWFIEYIRNTYKLEEVTRNDRPRAARVPRVTLRDLEDIETSLTEERKRRVRILQDSIIQQFHIFTIDLKTLIDNINNLYALSGFELHYFTFVNKLSPYYIIRTDNIELNPSTYELAATITPQEATDIMSDLSTRFFNNNVYKLKPPYDPNRKFRSGNYKGKNFGWSRKSLLDALVKNGLFEFTQHQFGHSIAWTLPKLIEIGIPPSAGPSTMGKFTYDTRAMNDELYKYEGKPYPEFVNYIPKYALEALYRIYIKPSPDWLRLCRSDISTARSLQAAVQRVLKIQIAGDKIQTCAALQAIVTTIQARAEIFEVAPLIISQPGGVQYLKYRPEGDVGYVVPESRAIDVRKWYTDVERVCSDVSKSTQVAYNLAISLGLARYVSENMDKKQICDVMTNYLRLLEQGRSL